MLLLELVGAGFAAALLVSLAVARSFGAAVVVAALGLAGWLAMSVYLVGFASCPANEGECEPGLAAFLLLFALAGWLAGALCGRLLRKAVQLRRP